MNPTRDNISLPPYPSVASSPISPGMRMTPSFNQNGNHFQFPMGRGNGQVHRHQVTTGKGDVSYHVGGNQFYFNKPGNYNVTLEFNQGGMGGAQSSRANPSKERMGAAEYSRSPPPSYFSDQKPRPPSPLVHYKHRQGDRYSIN